MKRKATKRNAPSRVLAKRLSGTDEVLLSGNPRSTAWSAPSTSWQPARALTSQLRGRLEEQGGPKVELELDALTGARLPTTVETVVFRITQEALTNVVKHAEAKTVRDWRRGCGSKRSGEPAPKVVAP